MKFSQTPGTSETVRQLIHLGGLNGPPMGSISYDGMVVLVDDRTLTHLQIVIVNKLRRGDTFLMSWKDSLEAGSGRSSIWLHPYVQIHFKFDGSRVPALNEQWLKQLSDSAESSRGLVVISERGEAPELVPQKHSSPTVTIIASTGQSSAAPGLPRPPRGPQEHKPAPPRAR